MFKNLFYNLLENKFRKNTPTYLGYKIVPLGAYCLPRVISTVSLLKPKKAQGEKTLPFDLAFCWNFEAIIDQLDNEFEHFYDGLDFGVLENKSILKELNVIFNLNPNAKHWINNDLGIIFNHEYMLKDKEEFKKRYDQRIENLYEYLKDERYEIYILVASFDYVKERQILRLKKIIERYRAKDSYKIVIINQCASSYSIKQKNVYVINETGNDFHELCKAANTNWVYALKNIQHYPMGQKFYSNITDNLKKIILHTR